MKNLLKGLSLVMLFLSFQGLASADIAAVASEKATDATAVVTDEEKKAEETAAVVADTAVPAVPVTEAK